MRENIQMNSKQIRKTLGIRCFGTAIIKFYTKAPVIKAVGNKTVCYIASVKTKRDWLIRGHVASKYQVLADV